MKKLIILTLLLSYFSAAYSQDLVKALQQLTRDNDSLQGKLTLTQVNSAREWQACNDSITRLVAANKIEVTNLNTAIRELVKDTAELQKQIKKLDKNNIKNLEAQLKEKKDSIRELKDIIVGKDGEIASIKNESPKKEQQKYNEGQQDVYNQIGQPYQKNTLDDLIKHSSREFVNRDLELIGGNTEAKKKLQDLKAYFTAQQVLKERYNEQPVESAKNMIRNIPQSDMVKSLNVKIDEYKLCSDGLKTTIRKIIELDKRFVANDNYTQETKLQDILLELSRYFRNYRFNFIDYPYLSDVVLEIMKLKKKDANADISNLFSLL
jgi:hypothetical protein